MKWGLAEYSSPVSMGGPAISLRDLDQLFERSTTDLGGILPIRKTSVGIWVPTPVSVIASGVDALEELGLLGASSTAGPIIDAGTGDGRVPAVLATLDPTRAVCGIEADATFYAHAAANWRELERRGLTGERVMFIEGDYCDVRTYESQGIDLRRVCMFLNYPDGHEKQLARFVAEHAGDATTLCLLTHDDSIGVDDLTRRERRLVRVDHEQDWFLFVYQGVR